ELRALPGLVPQHRVDEQRRRPLHARRGPVQGRPLLHSLRTRPVRAGRARGELHGHRHGDGQLLIVGSPLPARRAGKFPLGLALGLLLCLAARASATSFTVTPIQVVLATSTSSTLLTVANQSADTLRLEVSAFAWDQGPDGEM